jgi:hypothetical protein
VTALDKPCAQISGTKKPAAKAGSSGFQVHTGASEIMYMVPKPGSNNGSAGHYYQGFIDLKSAAYT